MLAQFHLPDGPWTGTLLSVAAVSGLPLVVTFLMARRATQLQRWLPQLTAFGAGAVFGAAVGHIIPEALRAGQTPLMVTAGVLAGFGVFALVEKLLAGHDHAHAHGVPLGAPSAHYSASDEANCVHLHPTPPSSSSIHHAEALAPMAFAGDAVHNFIDGSLIAAGFLTQPSVGVLTFIAVALHELPREVGTFGLYVHGGIRPMRAVVYNAVTGVIALFGAALTLLIGTRMTALTSLLLPVAAGTYLYIAQVVGRSALHDRHEDPTHWGRLSWSAVGAAMMLAAAFIG